jgi:PmbA protein
MIDQQKLQARACALVEAALKAGADAADAVISKSEGLSVNVRMGKVESTEAHDDFSLSLRVFIGRKVANVSANIGTDEQMLITRALAMAKAAPDDPWQELAPKERLATSVSDLDLYDPTHITSVELANAALEMEAVALTTHGITNSGGSSASAGSDAMVLATSSGFCGYYLSSRFSRGISMIAGEGTQMQRDYDSSSQIYYTDLEKADTIGRLAATRTVRKLKPKKAKTGAMTVVFDPRVSRSLAGCLSSAINGKSIARQTSFLRHKMNEQILNTNITVTDNPLRLRGSGSFPFDGEGICGTPLTMVENGVLKHWLLSHAVARELNLNSNGRGARSGSSIAPTSSNFAFEPGILSPQELLSNIGTGLYVTELIGHGIDLITGEYSKGAAGYWIENGILTHPISQVTIAGNLKDMFLNLTLANDLDRSFGTSAPTLAIEGMTLAGE